MWRAAGIAAPIEPVEPARTAPWVEVTSVEFDGGGCPPPSGHFDGGPPPGGYLEHLSQQAIWVWTDGSATAGVQDGGAGALIKWPDGGSQEITVPAGALCSSYRAEMVALREALGYLRDHPAHTDTDTETLIVCTDSQAALSALRSGPAEQRSSLNRDVWDALISLAGAGHRRIRLQWVPSHCGLRGNEKAAALAKAASGLPQEEVPVDTRTIYRAAARWARARAASQRPQGWYRHLMGTTAPPPVIGLDRQLAVDVHQLRAGHWSGSAQYLHRIGGNPVPGVRRVPRRRVPRWALPPLQRGAGHAESRPAAVPGADASPVPDHRQHPLPKGRRGSGGLVHRGYGAAFRRLQSP